jgi:hypothetical protein
MTKLWPVVTILVNIWQCLPLSTNRLLTWREGRRQQLCVVFIYIFSWINAVAFGRQQSCPPKAMESLFDPSPLPPLRTLWKWVNKRPPVTHLMTNDTNDCATNVLQLSHQHTVTLLHCHTFMLSYCHNKKYFFKRNAWYTMSIAELLNVIDILHCDTLWHCDTWVTWKSSHSRALKGRTKAP